MSAHLLPHLQLENGKNFGRLFVVFCLSTLSKNLPNFKHTENMFMSMKKSRSLDFHFKALKSPEITCGC